MVSTVGCDDEQRKLDDPQLLGLRVRIAQELREDDRLRLAERRTQGQRLQYLRLFGKQIG